MPGPDDPRWFSLFLGSHYRRPAFYSHRTHGPSPTFALDRWWGQRAPTTGGRIARAYAFSVIAQVRVWEPMLLCRVGSRLCGLPIQHIGETLRPLPVEPFADMTAFVLGLSIIRGSPVPVVHVASFLSGTAERRPPTRFVTIKAGVRQIALAVDEVVGVRAIASSSLGELPPLIGEASAEVAEAVGTLDGYLLVVLKSARMVPPSVWTTLERREEFRP
jgi:purine-binding chemotaxis protein CheW